MIRVSIGIPTRNGGEFLEKCLQNLAEQEYREFEVVISDNASTDETFDIAQRFVRQDGRFRYSRSETALTMAENFTRAKNLSTAPYFMWRADDDLADPDYLKGLVEALDATANAQLAVGAILRVIEEPLRTEKLFRLPKVEGLGKIDAICRVLEECHPSWFYGLWRRKHIDLAWHFAVTEYSYLWAIDHMTMLPASLSGAILPVEGPRFIQRIKRVAEYHLPPSELLTARRRYSRLARRVASQQNFSLVERWTVGRSLHRHMERRVAPAFTTGLRAIKRSLVPS